MNRFVKKKLIPLLLLAVMAVFSATYIYSPIRHNTVSDESSDESTASVYSDEATDNSTDSAWHSSGTTVEEADSSISGSENSSASGMEGTEVTESGTVQTETIYTPLYYTLHFVGDCTLAPVPSYAGTPTGYDTVVGTDYSYPFAKTVSYFEDDDFTFANMESCLTTSSAAVQKTFTFKAGADYANILVEGSVEFVTLANNHVLDYGEQGYKDTKAAIEAVGIGYAGRDEYSIYETESGLKIGVYAVSFGTVKQIQDGIEALKQQGAEFIIAAIHWGDEGSYSVNSEQITLAHAAVEAGADFVYGSHPHTLQPVEIYEGVYIYYSMGNWTFGGNTNPRDKDTVMVEMILRRDEDGRIAIDSIENIPCACSGTTDTNNYQPVVYEKDSEGYERVLSKLDGSFSGSNLSIGYSYSANE